jgi:flagellar biogenesis protein FliO
VLLQYPAVLLWPEHAQISISYRRARVADALLHSLLGFLDGADTARHTSMFCWNRSVTLSVLAAAIATPLSAETAPGPPDWADASGSVYLGMTQSAPAIEVPAVESLPVARPTIVEASVATAVHQAPASSAADRDGRRLGPPKKSVAGTRNRQADEQSNPAASRPLVDFGMPAKSIYTISSALAIVIGAFLLFAWVVRRGGNKTNAPLPAEVVSVLGRVPLAARQFAELLRVGNKLVLVSLTPTGAETLTEVTDPVEVDRLVGLCQQYSPHSTTKAFEQVFRQLSRETAPGGFFGGDSLPQLSSAAAAHRAHRGDTTRG